MCKLNKLPNDENKYNKFLSYFDTDLDSLDWDELNKNTKILEPTGFFYKKYKNKYMLELQRYNIHGMIRVDILFFANQKDFAKNNINVAKIIPIWNTGRKTLKLANEGNMEARLIAKKLGCSDIDSD